MEDYMPYAFIIAYILSLLPQTLRFQNALATLAKKLINANTTITNILKLFRGVFLEISWHLIYYFIIEWLFTKILKSFHLF